MEAEATVSGTSPVNIHPCYESHNATYVFTSSLSVICVLLYIFLGSLSVVTICGNLLVIISIAYFKQLRVPTNHLIASLAVADLLVGLSVFPFSMAFSVTSCWYQDSLFCQVRGSLDVTLSTASILNLCCISIDRYYAVCQPLSYRSRVTGRVIGGMILASWGAAALIGVVILIAGFNQGKCEGSCLIDAQILTTLACIFSFYIPVVIMLSIYHKIFLAAQRQAISIHTASCQSSRCGASVSKLERKATKTLATVMGVFLLCWTPFFLYIVFQPLTYDVAPVAVIEALNWLTLSNSTLNPFIYAFFYSWFRAAFRMIVSGKIIRGDFTNSKLL